MNAAQSPPIEGARHTESVRQTLAFLVFGVVCFVLAAYAVSLPFQPQLPL
jgi:hypothetical protein